MSILSSSAQDLVYLTFPLDEGTITVLKNGVMVLLDRDANLARALRWMLIVQ